MGDLTDIVIRSYIPFLANIGVLALLAWIVSIYGHELVRNTRNPRPRFALLIGGTFGGAAALLMNVPIEVEPGIFGDGRAVPILLSGILGGPLAALVAGGIGVGMRIFLGGGGMPSGVIYIALFAAASILTFWVFNRRLGRLPSLPHVLLIAAITTGVSSSAVLTFNPEARLAILTELWPLLLIANLIGIALLGGMLGREYARRMAEAQTRRERERADRAAQAKAKFLAAMSHEIRTPLNAILGVHQILSRGNLSDDAKEKIKTAQNSGQFLLALINQILDFAKIDAGSLPVKPAPFSVAEMMNAQQSIFHYQANAKGIDLTVSCDDADGSVVVADRNLVQQILFNLIGNAVKFTTRGSVQVRARVTEVEPGTSSVSIAVMDTGPGIPKDDQARIFEEFEQTETGVQRGGTGLGLAICKRIADTIGAQLSVQSEPGKGSTFTLSMKAPRGALKDCGPAPDEPSSVKPVTVLVVEDNLINQEIAKTMLEQDGHTVLIASDGQEALNRLLGDEGLPDIVFMDIQMPVMDGVEATEAIRRSHDPETLPIVALSANAFAEQQAEYIEVGMNAAISKPVQLAELRAVIQRFCRTRPAGKELPGAVVNEEEDPTVPVIDTAVLDPLISIMDSQKLTELTDSLKSRSAAQIARLRNVENDPELVGNISHDLKGMYSNFGLVRAARAAERIKDSPPHGNVEAVADELAREVERSISELDELLVARKG